MKIGLVLPYSIAKGGGVKEAVFAIRDELAARGNEVYVITPRPGDYEPPLAERDKIIFVGQSTDFNSPLHTTVQVSAGLNESIDAMLEKYRFDILHFHEPWVPLLSRQILTRSNAINVATFHAQVPETIMSRTLVRVVTPYTRSILKYLHVLTAVSDAAAEYVCSLTDEPVVIIPNGIDLEQYKPATERKPISDKKVIFYVGRLERRKGLKYLLHAYNLLSHKHDDVELVLGGTGPDQSKLEQMVEDMRLDNVRFLGYMSHEDKLEMMQQADVFCSPAIYGESFGIVLLEAMATGSVTVAGNNAGYESVLTGPGAISLVDPRHAEDFARRLELMLYEKPIRDMWLKWALKDVKRYEYSAVVDQYQSIYKRALKEHGRD